MAAAHALCTDHDVTLFEAAPRLGGHARTITAGKRGDQPVDTGFIVYNRVNYPNLVGLFEALDVPVEESDMSFAASLDGGRIEYSLQTLDTLFAQRRNALRPPFLRMVRDVLRFNARAADAANDPDQPLRDFVTKMGLGQEFRDWYLGPISGAIWSTPSQDVMDFPAQAMVRFFENHALLSHTGQHQWYTVSGGSVEYVRRLEAHLRGAGVTIRTGAPVASVRRLPARVEIRAEGAEVEAFDDVVLATHSDDSLRLLADADAQETGLLRHIRYQDNHAILHADPGAMPKRRKVWAAWNYREEPGNARGQLGLTYWMNRLQNIPEDDPLFVTLNATTAIREELIYDQKTFRHPVYDLEMMAAVEGVRAMNGHRNTWFCGAWMRNGFHEDGFASAVEAVAAMRARRPQGIAAA
ncbi:NAD(P)/FAD-dependent oxidoreductase [Jannaschia ovalis]|uniref:FAD-dependent oxidoreductase n=1 Tax=Jannaschia ovalis TaxID=3038773 RepID=A0ABY8LGI0_9RHOB|nr:FAD-dependent oxidoreductase [Jannaschia sp. GRR-S6-38]WGH80376.1 FAD-dependent oxidoreductase [Jannaschia sp. GRR-S6-38]